MLRSRTWVFQEAIVSPHSVAICGESTIDFEQIEVAILWLHHKRFVFNAMGTFSDSRMHGYWGAYRIWEFRRRISNGKCKAPFSMLLKWSPFGEASDIRDHVFGLLGLYLALKKDRTIPAPIQPDYRKCATDTLRDATIFAINEEKCLGILERFPLDQADRLAKLPSWVPAWWRPRRAKDASSLIKTQQTRSDWSSIGSKIENNGNTIRLKGISVDIVQQCAERVVGDEAPASEIFSCLRQWRTMSLRSHCDLDHPGHFGLTILGGHWWDSSEATLGHGHLVDATMRYLQETQRLPADPVTMLRSSSSLARDVARFCIAFMKASCERRFFVTKSGRIGIGPANTKAGDIVAILQGGRLPFILRPVANQYKMLGSSYVYGIMKGEAVAELQIKGENPVTFDII